jgi:hypothetical protein
MVATLSLEKETFKVELCGDYHEVLSYKNLRCEYQDKC